MIALVLSVPADTAQLRSVRRIIAGWAEAHDMPADSLALMATELLANSIAVSPPGELIEVRLRLDGEDVALSVSDRGRHDLTAPEIHRAGRDSVRGRGLHLVQSLSNRLVFERVDGTTTVTALQYRKMLSMTDQAVSTSHREDVQ